MRWHIAASFVFPAIAIFLPVFISERERHKPAFDFFYGDAGIPAPTQIGFNPGPRPVQ